MADPSSDAPTQLDAEATVEAQPPASDAEQRADAFLAGMAAYAPGPRNMGTEVSSRVAQRCADAALSASEQLYAPPPQPRARHHAHAMRPRGMRVPTPPTDTTPNRRADPH